ncbi:bifunctional metallophosphatase/5'-nucleotidase [Peribacillus saganii]|uniref:Bifunctional metallophosphatase/5'-nucleotidase n=1 Tax=Peribacillus saganii TaxID=2303992 RepID=A0A372LQ63_9BACI|nr:bifunctional UDP-sugar hydrolase/5'-nucleotidase [Peribacillus saganii]RFU70097.1 bifunctional metallophosphatase/5'-nucleotidase [Peribacillus saganii]
MSEILHFYHINDFHSHFENWPRICNFLKKRKELHTDTGEEFLLVDLGDHMDRWHPYTEATLGKGNVKLLNEAGFQYAAVGNNEGITLPHIALDSLYKEANFKVLAANLYEVDGRRPKWLLPYAIHNTNKGTRIGLVGLTAYFHAFYSELGWQVSEPFQELKHQLQDLKGKTDIIVVLSHLGLSEDERMAEDFPEIDIILGAHTHHILHEGKLSNQSLLCCAGKYGEFIGHVQVTIDKNQAVKKAAQLYDTNKLAYSHGEKEWEDTLFELGKSMLGEVVAVLPEKLSNDWFAPSVLPDLLCEALREWCDADCSFLNAGLLMSSLNKGPVTRAMLHFICPHPINPCTVTLTGSELKEVLLESRNEEWPHLQIKGFGFRGKIMGSMVYHGIEFKNNNSGGQLHVTINGNPIVPDQLYRLAIPDMFTFGNFFPGIRRSPDKRYYMPEFMRDLLAWKLKK